jgi:hypothetical protein
VRRRHTLRSRWPWPPWMLGSEAHRTVARDEGRGEMVAAQSDLRSGGARTRLRRRSSGCRLVMQGGAAGRGDDGGQRRRPHGKRKGSGGDGGGGGSWAAGLLPGPTDVARLLLPVGPDTHPSRPLSPQLWKKSRSPLKYGVVSNLTPQV